MRAFINARMIPRESVGIKMYDIKGDVRVFQAIENEIIQLCKTTLRRRTWLDSVTWRDRSFDETRNRIGKGPFEAEDIVTRNCNVA